MLPSRKMPDAVEAFGEVARHVLSGLIRSAAPLGDALGRKTREPKNGLWLRRSPYRIPPVESPL